MELTPDKSRRQQFVSEAWKVILGMFAITMVVYGDLLLMSDRYFISDLFGDTARYFVHIRSFGFGEFVHGNLPLWNPHLFSGTPMLGSFQAALLYPLNFPYLFLPISWATNVDICIHVFLLGLFTYAWIRNLGALPISAFFAATMTAFGGVTALRVLAGELTLLAGLTWYPFLFLCADRIIDRRSTAWCCAGIAGSALIILSGHPGTALRAVLALGLYILVRLWRCENRRRVVMLFGTMAVIPVFLTAAQLWTGIAVAPEAERAESADYEWATSYSLPPENLLTFFSPVLFGDHINLSSWGRTHVWDASIFVGITGLSLALCGAFFGDPAVRRKRIMFGLLAVFFILVSLGEYSPVYYILYTVVPGLSSLRGPGRFAFCAVLFLSWLAAHGVDRLMDASADLNVKRLGRALFVAGGGLLSGALAVVLVPDTTWHDIVFEHVPGDSKVVLFKLQTEFSAAAASALAAKGLVVAGLTTIVLACLILTLRKHTSIKYCVVLLGIAELLIFARVYRGSFPVQELERPDLKALYAENPGDYRILDTGGFNMSGMNYAMKSGKQVIWGYDPVKLYRYVKYISLTQQMIMIPPKGYGPMYSLVRCRFVVRPIEGTHEMALIKGQYEMRYAPKVPKNEQIVEVYKDYAPRFFFVQDYALETEPERIVSLLRSRNFDCRKTVILESEPVPSPGTGGVEASVVVVDESTDHVTLDIELSDAAIMVNTDAFSLGWRITSLSSEVDQKYTVMPAYLAIRAIPLAAGRHRIRLEYAPRAYRVGRWVSLISTLLFLSFCTGLTYRAWRTRRNADPQRG